MQFLTANPLISVKYLEHLHSVTYVKLLCNNNNNNNNNNFINVSVTRNSRGIDPLLMGDT